MGYTEKAKELRDKGVAIDDIHAILKADYPSISRKMVRAVFEDKPITPMFESITEVLEDGTRKETRVISATKEQLQQPREILKLHDLNPNDWELVKYTHKAYNAYSTQDGISQLYSSAIVAKPITGISAEELLEHFIKEAHKYSPVKPREIKQSSENIAIFEPADLHLGQLSWGEESGENYDSKIASERFKDITSDEIKKLPKIGYETIFFITGSDFFNSDNMDNKTTRGTQQTNDVRAQKMIKLGCDLAVWGVDAFCSAFKNIPIKTILKPGNHDELASYNQALYLHAWFRNDGSVEIDISPKKHKGFAYGNTALIFSHGGAEMKNLDWIYKEFRHLISPTLVTEVHFDHIHRIKVEEKNGAILRTNPPLAPLDNWSYGQGYGSTAQAITRVYSKAGLDFEIYSRA